MNSENIHIAAAGVHNTHPSNFNEIDPFKVVAQTIQKIKQAIENKPVCTSKTEAETCSKEQPCQP